jgi:hypothetical protein
MSDPASQDRVTIQLDRDLALSFFEWSYRFMTDNNPTFDHPADAIAVDQLSSELERALPSRSGPTTRSCSPTPAVARSSCTRSAWVMGAPAGSTSSNTGGSRDYDDSLPAAYRPRSAARSRKH